MKRTSQLKRKTRLKPKRPTPRRSPRTRDRNYMLWVKALPCLMRGRDDHDCIPPIEAHHTGGRPGMSIKSDDRDTVPLCSQAHREFHQRSGVFGGFGRDEIREWSRLAIAETRSKARRVGVLKEGE